MPGLVRVHAEVLPPHHWQTIKTGPVTVRATASLACPGHLSFSQVFQPSLRLVEALSSLCSAAISALVMIQFSSLTSLFAKKSAACFLLENGSHWEVPEKIVNGSLEGCADQSDIPGVHAVLFISDISLSICKI
jgi:hypothetical protein